MRHSNFFEMNEFGKDTEHPLCTNEHRQIKEILALPIKIDEKKVKELLNQRGNTFRLVDKVEISPDGIFAQSWFRVPPADDQTKWLRDHFLDQPLMPGVLQQEAANQLIDLVIQHFDPGMIFTPHEMEMNPRTMVLPGDEILVEVKKISTDHGDDVSVDFTIMNLTTNNVVGTGKITGTKTDSETFGELYDLAVAKRAKPVKEIPTKTDEKAIEFDELATRELLKHYGDTICLVDTAEVSQDGKFAQGWYQVPEVGDPKAPWLHEHQPSMPRALLAEVANQLTVLVIKRSKPKMIVTLSETKMKSQTIVLPGDKILVKIEDKKGPADGEHGVRASFTIMNLTTSEEIGRGEMAGKEIPKDFFEKLYERETKTRARLKTTKTPPTQ